MAEIAIMGGGKWGQALYFALGQKNRVKICSRRAVIGCLQIPPEAGMDTEYIVVTISSQALSSWLKNSFMFKGQKILVASKGIDAQSGKFLNEIFEEHIPASNLAYLSGPSFATEVMSSLPTAIAIHSKNSELAIEFSSFFPPFIKTYTSEDVTGGEIAGAYKNVIAIAGGICDGLGLGNNAKAALLSRGLVEMARFGEFFGGKIETFLGLAGSGDLFLTANSTLSRNYRVGLGLACGKDIEAISKELGEVAEGVATAKAVVLLSNKHSIHAPIAREVALIIEGKNVKSALNDLLAK